ncbi:MAG TPA: hypothetical protein VHC63_03505 [Acidimicrobiales bacterium]|nr:hypothetical protein [Acidimicrobiales bacterium]
MVAQVLAVIGILAMSGVAVAVSGGEYAPHEMDCTPGADAYDQPAAQPGCHTLKVNVESGGTRYAEVGVDQMPSGSNINPGLFGEGSPGSDNFPHAFCAAVNTNGTGGGTGNDCGTDAANPHGTGAHIRGDLNKKKVTEELEQNVPHRPGTIANVAANGVDVRLGADDNLDGGEHDGADGKDSTGTKGVQNGPSDGGAVRVFVHPQNATKPPTAYNPIPVAGASFGSCADGICEDATTYRHTVYRGDGSGSRSVADYDGKQWDPFGCSGADLKSEQACDAGPGKPRNLSDWKATEGETHADPGVQIYEDPDAQGSPIDPISELRKGLGIDDGTTPLYPLPGMYLGTCGVIVKGARKGPNVCG